MLTTLGPGVGGEATTRRALLAGAVGLAIACGGNSESTGNVTAPAAKGRRAQLDITTAEAELLGGLYVANDINAAGEIAGATMAGADYHAALRAGETVHDLGTLQNSAGSSALAINGLGQTTGYGWDSQGHALYSFVWTPEVPNGTVGSMRALPVAPDGSVGYALGINDAGQVLGNFFDSNNFNRCTALLWTAGGAIPLGIPGDGKSSAGAINNVGQVAGVVWLTGDPGGADTRGFLWTPDVPNGTTGTTIDLGPVSAVYSINDRGQVVGQKEGGAFLWTPSTPNGTSGTMTWLPMHSAGDINNEGQVAGDILLDGGENPITHAALWTPGTPNGATGIVTDLDSGGFDGSSAAWALTSQRDGSTRVVGEIGNWTSPALWTVTQEQAPPFSLTVAPAAVAGGNAATGTVVLEVAAPGGGATVALASDSAVATVPASVTVDAGATTATFQISTNPVADSSWATISAVYNGAVRHAPLGVTPALRVHSLDLPASIVGGWIANGTVYLNAPPLLDSAVELFSSDPTLATVPASVTVVGTMGSFEVLTSPVAVPTPVTITATFAGSTLSSTLILNPARALASLTVSPASVPGGTAATGTVTLDEVALAPVGISLFSRNEGVVTVPAGVTVPVGARSASFPISTTWTPYSIDVELDAYLYDPNGSKMRTATINVTHPVTLVAIGLNPDTVRGGTSSTGWVTLDGAAPPGGVAVALASSNTAIATVPVSVIVPAGVAVIDFNVSTAAGASGSVTISGSYAGTTRSAVLAVSAGPSLLSLSLSPTSVRGGKSATGTVRLTGAASVGGAVIALSSSSAVARVPATVTVPDGATSASFTVSTERPSSSTTARISAAFNGTAKSADLAVTR